MREIEASVYATPCQGVADLFGGPAFDTGAGAVCNAHVGSSVRISRFGSCSHPWGRCRTVPFLSSPRTSCSASWPDRRGARLSRARRSRAASPGEARFQSIVAASTGCVWGGYSDTTAQSQLTAGVCHATLHSCAPAFPLPAACKSRARLSLHRRAATAAGRRRRVPRARARLAVGRRAVRRRRHACAVPHVAKSSCKLSALLSFSSHVVLDAHDAPARRVFSCRHHARRAGRRTLPQTARRRLGRPPRRARRRCARGTA